VSAFDPFGLIAHLMTKKQVAHGAASNLSSLLLSQGMTPVTVPPGTKDPRPSRIDLPPGKTVSGLSVWVNRDADARVPKQAGFTDLFAPDIKILDQL
jgi:hypothetical protein